MKHWNICRTLCFAALTSGLVVASGAIAQPSQGGPGQSGYGMGPGMMGSYYGFGWMGGYGGIWAPILLVIVVAGAVAWVVARNKK